MQGNQNGELRGRTPRWGVAASVVLAGLVVLGFWLRVRGLAVEGFADDEVHKWLAATRYLRGDFGGDDVEHPMLMKWLIALATVFLRGHLEPEAITRLPNVVAGSVAIWALAQLGRRLFGRAVGLIAAAIAASSVTLIGYQRIAKEDTLLGLFLLCLLWCLAEAKAASTDGREREQRRWEVAGAACFGAMLASKYYLIYFLVPLLAWRWISRQDGGVWQLSRKRWVQLMAVSFVTFAAINWTPFMPSTYDYFFQHLGGTAGDDRAVSESLWFMGRLWGNLVFHYRNALPIWFYPVFFSVKLVPLTLIAVASGLGLALWRRGTPERIILVWMGVWFATFSLTGAKYGRMAVSTMPALFLLAAWAVVEVAPVIGRTLARLAGRGDRPLAAASISLVLAIALAGSEARAAVAQGAHYRLYINAIGGGSRNVDYFFPHCDYFDAGLREAVDWIAAHAEPGAEISSEVEWPVRYYAERAGRNDFSTSTITAARGCQSGRVCYVIVQKGRLYWHNQEALERLSSTVPVYVERIGGSDVVSVFRRAPGEPLFPASGGAGKGSR